MASDVRAVIVQIVRGDKPVTVEGDLVGAAHPSVGSAVVALGADENGQESVALWQLSPLGRGVAAWIVPASSIDEAVAAERLLLCMTGRAVTGADNASVRDVVDRLESAANVPAELRRRADQHFTPVEAFEDMIDRRSEFDTTIAGVRDDGRSVAPLDWSRDLDRRAESVDELRRLARLGRPEGAPIVVEVLSVLRVLGWLVEAWSETEQAKKRRSYLRDRHGEPEPLPPRWLAAASASSRYSAR